MAIVAECFTCGQTYKLSDDKAGRTFRCRGCSATVEVPGIRSRAAGSSRPRSSSGGGASVDKRVLLIGGIVGGFVLLLGIGTIIGMVVSSRNRAEERIAVEGEPGLSDEGIAAEDLSDEEKAKRQETYQASLKKRRQARGDRDKKALISNFGKEKVATVVINNVVGDTAAANRYLNRKIFRAAYSIYAGAQERASQQTKQNKDAAAQKALQEHKKQWGKAGPGFVRFEYKVIRSDLPYPRVLNMGRQDNTFTFLVGPAINLREFAEQIGVGSVSDVQGREIHIRAQLPTPIPDPDIEELVLQHGDEKVVRVEVHGAEGSPELVQLYLQNQTEALDNGGNKLSLVAMEALGNGRYQFVVAPVENAQVFAESLDWGQPENVDADAGLVTIAAQLPEHLPSRAELRAAEEKLRAEERKRQADENAIRSADISGKARPGEAELDWALRVLQEENVSRPEKALKALARMDVDDERREEVAKVLQQTIGKPFFRLKDQIPAILHWKTDDTEQMILQMGGKHHSPDDGAALMQALVELNTPTTARALATALTDFFSGDDSVRYLIKMGPLAEGPVLPYLKHKDARIRRRVYAALIEIGGRKSMGSVRSNVKLEKDPVMKALAEGCDAEIRARVAAAEEAAKAGAEGGDGE
ncbi:hypothetical protein Mal52_21860 [Symmachiella dynata]|uniref:Uncharacterized protein n=1 Tax=Symmachiella dynata TaxID=2527995 RepID=A0A517ZMK1_9PLAN|nr:hypothetical protein [Symmachiella dynata]QDU43710.1 hypothetical protein Mal52_21860 [Symmachiella dynata]